jgi:hypothetical protein
MAAGAGSPRIFRMAGRGPDRTEAQAVHRFGLLVATLALGGVRVARRDDHRGVPPAPLAPIDAATHDAWDLRRRRGDAVRRTPFLPAVAGQIQSRRCDALERHHEPETAAT